MRFVHWGVGGGGGVGEHTGPAIRLTDQTMANFLLVEVSVLFEVFVKLVIPRTSTHTVFYCEKINAVTHL